MNLAAPASPLSLGSLAQLTLSLLLIVGIIFALSGLLKRWRVPGMRGRGGIAVLDELILGPRERVVLIGVGDAQVLLGIGAAGLVPLAPLAAPIALPAQTAAPAFADKLREMMKRGGAST